MRAKQLIASLIFVVVSLEICVEAQFFNFNTATVSNLNNNNNNVVRTQSQRRSQQNVRVSRQQPLVQQQRQTTQRQQQSKKARPVQDSQIDTIIIIETEPQRQPAKPTQRQTQRQQQQVQQPQRQQQTRQPQRQQQTQQSTQRVQQSQQQTQRQQQTQQPNQRQSQQQTQRQQQRQTTRQPQRQQQTQRPQQQSQQPQRQQQQVLQQQTQRPQQQSQQPQRQQQQQSQQQVLQRQTTRQPQRQQHHQQQQASQTPVQQQYYQQSQTQYQRPTHEDAPVVFPGSTNNPHRQTEQSVDISRPSNPFVAPTTAISPLSQGFVGNSGNFGNNGLNSFSGSTTDGFVAASTGSFNTFGETPVGPNSGISPAFGNDVNTGFLNSAQQGGFVQNNGFIGATPTAAAANEFGNGFDNTPAASFNNFAGNTVGGNFGSAFDQNRWYNPHRPQGNYYRNFAAIFNDIDQKAENDYNTSEEDDGMNDDFNGRSVVSPGQYPHMAALGYRTSTGETEFKCGGSLISEMFVLTAAHCCFLNGQAPHLVKIGDIKLKEFEHNIVPQRRGIARVHKHPYYNSSMVYHDIGLLELTNPIEYTFFVRPIRLWARDEIPYSKVFTMGYGSTSFAQAPTNVLTELDLSIVPLEMCNRTMPSDSNAPYGIAESQICAKDYEKNRDTCQGDSGGPLQLNLERPRRRRLRYYLVGVISYGTFCRSRYPGVYTRVSSYIDWIASIVWPGYFNNFQ